MFQSKIRLVALQAYAFFGLRSAARRSGSAPDR